MFFITFQKSGVNLYNTFMKEFKEVLISKARRDFFDQLCTGGIDSPHFRYTFRTLIKTVLQKNNFLISQQKHM